MEKQIKKKYPNALTPYSWRRKDSKSTIFETDVVFVGFKKEDISLNVKDTDTDLIYLTGGTGTRTVLEVSGKNSEVFHDTTLILDIPSSIRFLRVEDLRVSASYSEGILSIEIEDSRKARSSNIKIS